MRQILLPSRGVFPHRPVNSGDRLAWEFFKDRERLKKQRAVLAWLCIGSSFVALFGWIT